MPVERNARARCSRAALHEMHTIYLGLGFEVASLFGPFYPSRPRATFPPPAVAQCRPAAAGPAGRGISPGYDGEALRRARVRHGICGSCRWGCSRQTVVLLQHAVRRSKIRAARRGLFALRTRELAEFMKASVCPLAAWTSRVITVLHARDRQWTCWLKKGLWRDRDGNPRASGGRAGAPRPGSVCEQGNESTRRELPLRVARGQRGARDRRYQEHPCGH
jgi:hypothetical protein